MKPVRVGVWGVGVWGEKHARVFSTLPDASLVGVYDRDAGRAAEVAARHGGRVFETPESMLGEVDAVSVAVPTVAHRETVEFACAAGRHVLVEKPMAYSPDEADAMIAAAMRAGVMLQVGQVERFNPVLIAARPNVRAPRFIEGHRLAPFQPRSLDIDVVFDLMIHDIDAVLDIVGAAPVSVSAVGVAVLSAHEDIANARLEFADGCVANLTASRVSVERLRRLRFFQSDAYLSVDLFERTGEMFRIREPNSFRPGQVDPLALLAGIERRSFTGVEGEPLGLELGAFVRAVRGEGVGAASASAGRAAVAVAAEVQAAMRRRAQQWATTASPAS